MYLALFRQLKLARRPGEIAMQFPADLVKMGALAFALGTRLCGPRPHNTRRITHLEEFLYLHRHLFKDVRCREHWLQALPEGLACGPGI